MAPGHSIVIINDSRQFPCPRKREAWHGTDWHLICNVPSVSK